jgi:hypothetical protein
VSVDEAQEPPATFKALVKLVGALANDLELPHNRVQRHLAVLIVAEMLSRASDLDGNPMFLVKGGSMIELRIGIEASRTSKDLDTAFRGSVESVADVVREVIEAGWNGFTARIAEVETINVPGLLVKPRRLTLQLSYGGKPWAKVPLEVSSVEASMAAVTDSVVSAERAHLGLESLGLPETSAVECVSLHYQVAQKLHACTAEFPEPRENERAHDLVDLILLRPLIPVEELERTLAACVDVFEARAAQPWPPVITVPEGWHGIYERAFDDVMSPLPDLPEKVETAAAVVQEWVAEIGAAGAAE